MEKRFRYRLEAALQFASAAEEAASRRHARAALACTRALGARLGEAGAQRSATPAPAGVFDAVARARERARAAAERELAAARISRAEARRELFAARDRCLRLEADRARRAVAFRRERALRDERRRFVESLCSPGAFAFASETAAL